MGHALAQLRLPGEACQTARGSQGHAQIHRRVQTPLSRRVTQFVRTEHMKTLIAALLAVPLIGMAEPALGQYGPRPSGQCYNPPCAVCETWDAACHRQSVMQSDDDYRR